MTCLNSESKESYSLGTVYRFPSLRLQIKSQILLRLFLLALLGHTPEQMQATGVSAEERATLPVQGADRGSLCVPRGHQNATKPELG